MLDRFRTDCTIRAYIWFTQETTVTAPRMSHPRNMHGRHSIPGMAEYLNPRRVRRVLQGRKHFVHPSRNGIYDPLTFYHILDVLLDLAPDELFRTTEFIHLLRETKPRFVWNTVTVGRVINDMAESLQNANGRPAIRMVQRWNGRNYVMSGQLEDRVAMENLLDDLHRLCEQTIEQEVSGTFQPRLETPMLSCPSVSTVRR